MRVANFIGWGSILALLPACAAGPLSTCDLVSSPSMYDGETVLVKALFLYDGIENSHASVGETCPAGGPIAVAEDRSGQGEASLFWQLTKAYKRSSAEQRYGVSATVRGRFHALGRNGQPTLDIHEAEAVVIVQAPPAEPPPPSRDQ